MANKLFWQIIIGLGIFPFAIAILDGAGAATLEYTTDFDFSIFTDTILNYSFDNWLTYFMGVLLVLISLKHLRYE